MAGPSLPPLFFQSVDFSGEILPFEKCDNSVRQTAFNAPLLTVG